jgi:hypothetical protein
MFLILRILYDTAASLLFISCLQFGQVFASSFLELSQRTIAQTALSIPSYFLCFFEDLSIVLSSVVVLSLHLFFPRAFSATACDRAL